MSYLVTELDHAASLINIGNPDSLVKAKVIINDVNSSVIGVWIEGIQATTLKNIVVGYTITILVVFGLIIYFYGSRIFWVFWLRTKRDWKAEAI